MNRLNQSVFHNIGEAIERYREDCREALQQYRNSTVSAELLKDPKPVLEAAKASCRVRYESANRRLNDAVKEEAARLETELKHNLTVRPDPALVEALRLYADFSLPLSRPEVEAMLTINAGNLLGLRAINSALEKTNSPLRVDVPDAAAFDADLTALRGFAEDRHIAVPLELRSAAVEVFGGTAREVKRADGTWYSSGETWDGLRLSLADEALKTQAARFEDMAEHWQTVAPSIRQLSEYKPAKVDEAQSIKDSFINDSIDAIERQLSSLVPTNSAEEYALRSEAERAEANRAAAEAISHYTA